MRAPLLYRIFCSLLELFSFEIRKKLFLKKSKICFFLILYFRFSLVERQLRNEHYSLNRIHL